MAQLPLATPPEAPSGTLVKQTTLCVLPYSTLHPPLSTLTLLHFTDTLKQLNTHTSPHQHITAQGTVPHTSNPVMYTATC
jgi:hypothetical protein